MAFLPKTTGYLHLFPLVCPGPQLMLSWPPQANSHTPRQPGTVPMAVGHRGQENACLLPIMLSTLGLRRDTICPYPERQQQEFHSAQQLIGSVSGSEP